MFFRKLYALSFLKRFCRCWGFFSMPASNFHPSCCLPLVCCNVMLIVSLTCLCSAAYCIPNMYSISLAKWPSWSSSREFTYFLNVSLVSLCVLAYPPFPLENLSGFESPSNNLSVKRGIGLLPSPGAIENIWFASSEVHSADKCRMVNPWVYNSPPLLLYLLPPLH